MGRESQVPWFPAWGIEFSNPIDDILAIVLEFNSFRPSNRWLLVAFDAIASEMHLWTTWYSMRRREVSGSMVAKTPDAEFLRKFEIIYYFHSNGPVFFRIEKHDNHFIFWAN